MHVFVGFAVIVFAFVASKYTSEALAFGGLLNPPALVLLSLGPLGASLVAHPFSEWRRNLAVLLRAFRHDKRTNFLVASREMEAIARAVRESRWQDAEDVVARAESEQVKAIAPHLLARLELDALHEAIASTSFGWMVEVKAADDFMQGLARFSPAFGMIGTIMGLVDLFKNMRDSASLGPGMAMALLATLYGLILCYIFYMPLAQRIRTYLVAGAHEQRVIERAVNMIIAGRPVGEVKTAVLDGASESNGHSAAASVGAPEQSRG